MNKQPKAPPARMRNYRVEAEMRPTPDLHRLAQVFVNLALARTEAERRSQPASRQAERGEVES